MKRRPIEEAEVRELTAEARRLGLSPDHVVASEMADRAASAETDDEFLARLRAVAEDWRFSHEFIGLVVRQRFPKKYNEDRAYPPAEGLAMSRGVPGRGTPK